MVVTFEIWVNLWKLHQEFDPISELLFILVECRTYNCKINN